MVGGLGKYRIPTQSADAENTFPVLCHAKVGRVDFPQMDTVARSHERHEKVEDTPTVLGRQESFNVLKNERGGSVSNH